jgi:peroxiredoxin
MKTRLSILAGLLLTAFAGAADVETDWKTITALDAGPQQQPKSAEEARTLILVHLTKQERALRSFIETYPKDARVFEAKLRLARLLQIRGDLDESEALRAEGKRMLDALEKTATPAQRVEIDFSKITRLMRNMRQATPARREELLTAARKFYADYPTDRRVAALLTEVSTLFDSQPKIKEDLLLDAKPLATDEELKSRIADDLKRVRLLGQEVPLSFTSVQGKEIRLADFHGQPVLIVFFAGFSSPSLAAMTTVQKAVAELPKGSVQVIGVCLDEKRDMLDAVMKGRAMTWPVAFDGKGWESPLVRSLGINTLPTVWLLDGRGRLRSLNAAEGTASQVQQILRER